LKKSKYDPRQHLEKKQLTIDQIKQTEGFQHLSDDEAMNISNSLRILAELTFKNIANDESKQI